MFFWAILFLWKKGILIYEMLAGYPPFFDDNPFGIYEKILAGKIEWPRHLDPIAKDLVKKLLVQDRTKRLGNMKVAIIIAIQSMSNLFPTVFVNGSEESSNISNHPSMTNSNEVSRRTLREQSG